MISLRTPTGNKVLIPRGVMNAVGVKKSLDLVAMQTGSGLVDLWTPAEAGGTFTITVNPVAPAGYGAGPYTVTVPTGNVVATATGQVGAVTWAWAFDSGDVGITISAPTAATTEFYAAVNPGVTLNADFTVFATDSIGRTAESTISVSLTNYFWGGY